MKHFVFSLLCGILVFFSCGKNTQEAQEAEVKVSSVSLNDSSVSLVVGETVQLRASIQPSNATEKDITWASSEQSVATVSNSGLVTAVAEGSATITASAGGKSAECKVNVAKKVIDVTSVELNKTSLELVEGESETLIATVKPDDATDKTVMWSSSNPMIASVSNGQVVANSLGETFITASVASLSAKCKVTIRQAPPAGATDMGLSVYWASCNLEANKPEQYGGFFAWGETKSKKSFTKKNYSFDWYSSHGGWGNDMILYPNEDAAHVILGGRWRMPTRLEWDELVNSCDWIWTVINTEEGNVSGFKVVSRINGQSIFIPAAGCNSALTVFNSDSEWTDKGRLGCYWTSSMCVKQYSSRDISYGPYRMLFKFDEEDFEEEVHKTSLYTSPEHGLTIRPVCE